MSKNKPQSDEDNYAAVTHLMLQKMGAKNRQAVLGELSSADAKSVLEAELHGRKLKWGRTK